MCTEDMDLTFIPNGPSNDTASLHVTKGYMLAQEKKILWSNTKASVTELSTAVKILKASSKILNTKIPGYVIELATLIIDQTKGGKEDKKDDIIRKIHSSLHTQDKFCLRLSRNVTSSCTCTDDSFDELCYQPFGKASLPNELQTIIEVMSSNKELVLIFPDQHPKTVKAAKRLAVALLCREAWDIQTRIYREWKNLSAGHLKARMEEIYPPWQISTEQVVDILETLGFQRDPKDTRYFKPPGFQDFEVYCQEVLLFNME